jgi:hypothetical protein
VTGGLDGRTRVADEADLRLEGVSRIAEPFLSSPFRRMGADALDGLRAQLERDPARLA